MGFPNFSGLFMQELLLEILSRYKIYVEMWRKFTILLISSIYPTTTIWEHILHLVYTYMKQ